MMLLQEKFIPSKSVKSHQSQPWITHGLKKQLKKKRKLYKTRNENLKTLATYKKVRSQIQRQIRKALLVLVLVYTQEGSLWSIVLRCDDHTGIFTCDGCARDPYFYVPAETQSYVIKLSCSRKVLAASGD